MKPIYKFENYHPYISAFKANKYELSEVLTYIKDMMHIDINDKVYKSKYPPSELLPILINLYSCLGFNCIGNIYQIFFI